MTEADLTYWKACESQNLDLLAAIGYPHERDTMVSPEEYAAELKRKADAFNCEHRFTPEPKSGIRFCAKCQKMERKSDSASPPSLSDEQIADLVADVAYDANLPPAWTIENASRLIAFLRAALAVDLVAQPATDSGVSESPARQGVPLQATTEMKLAGQQYASDTRDRPKGLWWWGRLYEAMLAAAPRQAALTDADIERIYGEQWYFNPGEARRAPPSPLPPLVLRFARAIEAHGLNGSPARQGAEPDGQDLNPVSVKDLSASASPATKEQQ